VDVTGAVASVGFTTEGKHLLNECEHLE